MKLNGLGADMELVSYYRQDGKTVFIREDETGRFRFDVHNDVGFRFIDGDGGFATGSEAIDASKPAAQEPYTLTFDATPATLDTIPAGGRG